MSIFTLSQPDFARNPIQTVGGGEAGEERRQFVGFLSFWICFNGRSAVGRRTAMKENPPRKKNVNIYLYNNKIKYRKKIVLRVVAVLVRVTHTHSFITMPRPCMYTSRISYNRIGTIPKLIFTHVGLYNTVKVE